eukprot:1126645-Pyramimonas_sp.AAC.1
MLLSQALVESAPKNSTTATYALPLLPASGAETMAAHQWASCAVVGNSGVVLGSGEKGAQIDQADVVVSKSS